MSSSFQDVYAKHLLYKYADYGYPLRMPEPMSTLPEYYQNDGLQIGDLGIVDRKGQFEVLFNICKRSDNPLHRSHGVPKNFQPIHHTDPKSSDNAILPGPIYSRGIQRILHPDEPRPADYYEFDSSAATGAILILPQGATSVELSTPEQFREVAMKNALHWYEFAKKRYNVLHLDRSLYLITGFCKARSWALGSFDNPGDAMGKILARKDHNNPHVYTFEFKLSADYRHGLGVSDSGSTNHTVFITGFRITISNWLPEPMVHNVTESPTIWSILVHQFVACLKWLRGSSGGHRQYMTISVEDSPAQLSQPFHPLDIINRFLLNEKPNAEIAITHDNQWMYMMKVAFQEGLTHENLLQEDRLGTFLARCYSTSVDTGCENAVVFLQRKADSAMNLVLPVTDLDDRSAELGISDPSAPEPEVSPLATPTKISSPTIPEPSVLTSSSSKFQSSASPSAPNPRIVITCIRAQNIFFGLKWIPAGFYVLAQFDGSQRRTQNKPIRFSDSSIEWKDQILLPSNALDNWVQFNVHASFELKPMLGDGEVLYTSEVRLDELIGGTYLIELSPRESGTAAPDPSLLITMERWYSNRLAVTPTRVDSNLDLEESILVRETNLGQKALLRYYDEFQGEHLRNAVQHFKRAQQDCPLTSQRPAVLVNLAKAEFISYQADQTSASLDESIGLYEEALTLRDPDHPDKPATLLQLAQALLFRYKEGYDESVADKIKKLMTGYKVFPEDSHERRAAELVLETLERYRTVNSGSLTELDEMVGKLEHSATLAPDNYFDRPQRLINLSAILWRRYKRRGEHSDFDRSFEKIEHALGLLPGLHPDRLCGLKTLNTMLWQAFKISRDPRYSGKLSMFNEETLQLIPEGHPERPYWATGASSARYLAELLDQLDQSERLGDVAFEAQEYDEAIVQYSQALECLQASSLSSSFPFAAT